MKRITLFFTLFFSVAAYGQFAIINDKDGSTNVRKGSEKRSAVIDVLKNGHLVYSIGDKNDWTNIDYSKNGKELNGYIYKDRYTLISGFWDIPIYKQANDTLGLAKDSIEIIVTLKAFDKSRHKYKYFKDAKDQVDLIDNKKYWGTDGGMPKTEYRSISIKIGQKIMQLPNAALANLYEPGIYNTQANFDKEKNIIYIQAMNSDGAGAYEVVWKIEKGVYKERFIVYGF